MKFKIQSPAPSYFAGKLLHYEEMIIRALILFLVAAAAGFTAGGCEGSFAKSGADGSDAGDMQSDSDVMTEIPADALPDPADDPVIDVPPDPAVEELPAEDPTDPCFSVTCGDNAHCVAGSCVCDDGYVDAGGVCREADPGDPESRTEEEVCARWRADYPTQASWVWNEGPTQCDPGEVNDTARDDGVRRINLYRWLCGLGPVTRADAATESAAQACAIMIYRNGTLNHHPPASWDCYTAQGADAAGSSNLAMGSSNPAGSIDQYVEDRGNARTMGHRRWILNPPYGRAGLGHASSYNCQHVFDWSGSSSRSWVGFPAPGPYPVQAAMGSWTFHGDGVGSATRVTVVRESTGTDLGVSASLLDPGYGQETVSFDPGEANVGETYVVTVTGLSGSDVTYRIRIIDCG